MASTRPWEERCGEQERKTRKCLQGRPIERGSREHKAETAGLYGMGRGAGAGERASGAVAEGAWRPACALVT